MKKLPQKNKAFTCWKWVEKSRGIDLIFLGKGHFEDDGTQKYLVFQTTYRYFKTVSTKDSHILSWKPKGLSDESVKLPSTSNKLLNPSVNYVDIKALVKFKGDCLKSDKISFNHGQTVNIYIVYEVDRNVDISSYPTLEKCLFGAVKLTKHVDIDLYKYSGDGIGFDRKGFFSTADEIGRKVIIFGADMSYLHILIIKYISFLGKGITNTGCRKIVFNQLY